MSDDLLEQVQGGCHKHRRCGCPSRNAAPASQPTMGPSPSTGGAMFQQIMQVPAQWMQGAQGYPQQQPSFDPSQFAAQSQPQSGGEVQTSVQVGQQ